MESPSYFSEPFCRNMAWVDLLMLANFRPAILHVRGVRIEVMPGEVGCAKEILAARWKWSRGKVRRWLDEIEKEGRITQQKSHTLTKITIVNFKKFQSQMFWKGTSDETTDGQQEDQQAEHEERSETTKKGNEKEYSASIYFQFKQRLLMDPKLMSSYNETLPNLIDTFHNYETENLHEWRNYSDYRKHFVSWIPKYRQRSKTVVNSDNQKRQFARDD